VRLKSATSKEQKSCTNKMSDNSQTDSVEEGSDVVSETKDNETSKEVINFEAKDDSLDKRSKKAEILLEKRETPHSDSEVISEEKTNVDNKDDDSKEEVSVEHVGDEDIDHKTDEKHSDPDSADEELSKSDEIKDKSLETNEQSEQEKKSEVVSKLNADALSASLSSSRCILKRNRDDLDSDDDSEEEEEEPFSKKSHIGEVTPKHVSKLKSMELLASMSSSNKSLLKRGIEKVDKAEESADAPESKKSNLSQANKPEKAPTSESTSSDDESPGRVTERKELKNRKPLVNSAEESSPPPYDVKLVPKTLKFPPKSPVVQNPEIKTVFSSSRVSLEKPVEVGKEEVKEEVKQKIGAKELAGQRQLERKRLNKMLSIFDDQKIVK